MVSEGFFLEYQNLVYVHEAFFAIMMILFFLFGLWFDDFLKFLNSLIYKFYNFVKSRFAGKK